MKNILIFIGNFFFRWRDAAFSFVFLAAFIIVGERDFAVGGLREDLAFSAAGLLFLIPGQFVRAITIGYAYIKRGGLNKQIFAETLVRRGVFAHSRNPMYVGNLLIVTGAILSINIFWYHVVALPVFYLIYFAITLAEERFLGEKFGAEYERYCKEVNRYLPGDLGKWRESIKDMTFTWKRLINKEHNTFSVVFGGITAYTALKLIQRHDLDPKSPPLIALYALFGAILLFNIVAGILKRTGRLQWEKDRP